MSLSASTSERTAKALRSNNQYDPRNHPYYNQQRAPTKGAQGDSPVSKEADKCTYNSGRLDNLYDQQRKAERYKEIGQQTYITQDKNTSYSADKEEVHAQEENRMKRRQAHKAQPCHKDDPQPRQRSRGHPGKARHGLTCWRTWAEERCRRSPQPG